MKQYGQNSPQDVIDPTDARQASPRKDNYRVLVTSLSLAVIAGIVLVAGFWALTPTGMDYSSGGKLGESGSTPAQTAPNNTQ